MAKQGWSGLGPMYAIFQVMQERQHLASTFRQRLSLWLMRKFLKETRPGWNDYWMVRWQLTKDCYCVWEIHRRSCHIVALPTNILTLENPIDAARMMKEPWYRVAWSARWMVNSQRREDPEFAAAIEEVERDCPQCRWVPLTAQSS